MADILEEFYNKQKEKIYLGHTVINIKKAENRQEELFQLGEYLPSLLRSCLDISYFSRMEKLGVIDEVFQEMSKHNNKTREESTIEFFDWINKHEQFKDLINKKEVTKLNKKLNNLDKNIEKLQKNI